MALAIASGFSLQAQIPNFERDMFDTVADMKAYPATSLPDIFITTVKDDGIYLYKASNSEDATTGKWRKVEGVDSIQADFEAIKDQVDAWKDGMSDDDLAKSIETLISEAIANVVADAPEAFDTLKEIADWIGDDTLGTIKDLAKLRENLDDVIALVGELPTEQKKDTDGNPLYKKKDGSETTSSSETLLENGYRITKIFDGSDAGFFATEAEAIQKAKDLTVTDGNSADDYATYYTVAADTNANTVATEPIMVKTCAANTVVEYVDEKMAEIVSSGVTYTDTEGAVKAIGGWEVGEKADKMSFQDFAYKLLHPYVAQEVSLSISPSALQDKTAGGVSSVTLTANVTKHSNSIVSVTFYAGSDVIESLTSGVANGGSFTSTYTPASAIDSNTTFKVVVSDGKSTNVNATKTLSFAYPAYIGYTDAATNVDGSNLGTLITNGDLNAITLTSSKGYTQTFSGTDVRAVYVFDSGKGSLSSIKDSNNFEYIGDFSKTTATYNGTTYNIYQKKVAATVNNFKFIYA